MINLTGNTILHCNCTTGNDSTGNGTSGAPFQTPKGAILYLAGVNLNGYYVTIQLDIPGTYNCSFTVCGKFMGQTGNPAQLTIQGNKTGNIDLANTYILSAVEGGGGCITAVFGAVLTLKGLKFDMYNSMQGSSGIYGGGMALNIGTQALVVCSNTVWGYQTTPFEYINVGNQAQVIIENTVWCNPQSDAVMSAFIGVGQSSYAALTGKSIWLNCNIPTFTMGIVHCDEGGDVTWADCAFIQKETYFPTTFTKLSANTISIPYAVKDYLSADALIRGDGFPNMGAKLVSGLRTTTLVLDIDPTTTSGAITIGSPSAVKGPGFCIGLGSLLNTGTPKTMDVDTTGDIMYFPGDRFTTTLATVASKGDTTIDVASIGNWPISGGAHTASPAIGFGFFFTQCIQGVGIAADTRIVEVNGNIITLSKPIVQNMTVGTLVNVHGASTNSSCYR